MRGYFAMATIPPLSHLREVEERLSLTPLCLLYVKSADCGLCDAMLLRIGRMLEDLEGAEGPGFDAFSIDIREEPSVSGRFLVLSAPTALLFLDGKEVYRAGTFIDVGEVERKIRFFLGIVSERTLS